MVLTPSELEAYTHRERSNAQRRVLDFMKVPYRVRPDKSLAVLRIHVEGFEGEIKQVEAEPEMQD